MFRLSQKAKPVVLCILDGWGIAPDYPGNAITQANCTNFNRFWFTYPHTLLTASGLSVGMPENTVGTSEVGHLNMGAGHIVYQDVLRIDNSIADGTFYDNEALLQAVDHSKKNNSNIHLLGLVGWGVVHSRTEHLIAILEILKREQIPRDRVKIHLITDGRDSPPSSALDYVEKLLEDIEQYGVVSSVSGRYYVMDRDNRWDRTQLAYWTLLGQTGSKAANAVQAITASYANGLTDEFIKPVVIADSSGKPMGAVAHNDAFIFFNFRQDRARQITKCFVLESLTGIKTSSGEKAQTFNRGPKIPNLFFVTLTQYEKDLPVSAVAFEPRPVPIPLSRVFSESNDKQFHIAETEKYAHVTYFFNGGNEAPFPGEDRLLINSKKVASYDQAPEMSAPEITKEVIKRITSRAYDFIVINYANADMVAHTGDIHATIKAAQVVDFHLGILMRTVLSVGGAFVLTADHGNAEVMLNPKTGEKDTAHNLSPVPCIIMANDLRGKAEQLKKGILADVAPTILALANIPKPPSMTGRNLLE